MNKCLICFNSVEETIVPLKVCKSCINQFEVMEKTILLDKVEVLILYKYNDFFKEILYRYKGCYDYLLKDAFLNNYIVRLKRKYKNYFIVCAPSYKGDDKKRGFNHITEIAKVLSLPIIDCLRKSKNYKQSDQKMKDRNAVKNIIKIDKSKLKNVKRVLILDDVTTSLSTLKTIIGLLPTNIAIKALVLASNCRFEGNENV